MSTPTPDDREVTVEDRRTARRARDRDDEGRAHNARPRDRLGRPLRRDAEGVTPPGPDDEVVLSPAESLVVAQDLLDTGWPFRAHEILEATWKQTSGDERAVWKGLAQLAVGVTHAERGNPAGARRLIERGRDAIDAGSRDAPDGIDVDGLRAWADAALRTLLEVDGPLVLPTPHLGRMSP
jgi:hypothetical protein